MRMPRVRFTLRRMMVAVALVGILTGAWLEASRQIRSSRRSRVRASGHRFEEALALKNHARAASILKRAISTRSFVDLGDFQIITGTPDDALASLKEAMESFSRRVEYHRAMRVKYEHATRYPWLPVAPDPPNPG